METGDGLEELDFNDSDYRILGEHDWKEEDITDHNPIGRRIGNWYSYDEYTDLDEN